MSTSLERLHEMMGRLWSRPDELMLQSGADGELLAARMRALLCALVLLLPLAHGLSGGSTAELLIGIGAAIAINIVAQLWLALARRRRAFPWLPYATGTTDVTMTTGVLVLLGLADRVAALNSMVVWAFYLLAIALTALRNDGRLTLYVGGQAVVQFALLAGWVFLGADAPGSLVSVDYGTASVSSTLQRVVVLLLMTLLTGTVVYRMQRLIESSGNDGLTGLPNRAWLMQRMPGLLQSLKRDGGQLTLALLDIDNFGRINDEASHMDGDRAIRHIAAFLNGMLEEEERIVRLGGQEFVLLLRCPLGSAWERIDRTRRALTDLPFAAERANETFILTFSGGLASWPQDGADARALLGSADRRLQAAKHAGRNRVLVRDV